jgi:hypothetical protein
MMWLHPCGALVFGSIGASNFLEEYCGPWRR